MDGSKMKFFLGWTIFRGYVSSGRVSGPFCRLNIKRQERVSWVDLSPSCLDSKKYQIKSLYWGDFEMTAKLWTPPQH